MRTSRHTLVLAFFTLATATLSAVDTAPSTRPNVLFIAVDDLRPELGCYGKDYIRSPNIDRLAQAGLVFNRAYCQQAVCSPSRTVVMTGVRPDTSKVWDLVTHFRVALPDVVTLGQHFKQNGYFVQGMGKIYHGGYNDEPTWSVPWQNPKAPVYALPENVALSQEKVAGEPDGTKGDNRGAAPESYTVPGSKAVAAAASGKKGKKAGDGEGGKANTRGPIYESVDVPDNTYTDGKAADLAVTALRELSGKGQPFFLAVGFIKPHLPWVAPKKYWNLYDPAKIALAPNPYLPKDAPEYAINPNDGEFRAYKGVPPEGPVPDDVQHKLKQAYFAGVSYTDAQVGKVLAELDRLGLRKNTIIVLWGDHGWKLGEHAAWGKHTNVENDVNAPLIVSAPGMKHPGAHTDALVEFVDIYPTLCDLLGLSLPAHLEGTSARPLLDDPQRPWKTAAFSQYPRSGGKTGAGQLMGYTMRTDRYRFTAWVGRNDHTKVDAIELYDHQTDPQENINIAKDPANAELVKKLMEQWTKGWPAARPPLPSQASPPASLPR
ncbi:MAG: sulfatase [Chthoniobacter sp.]|uniref:sulfatase n=1 Tax=Chthoniobacter sp. TaxID=2510640 RepID=UPI0032AB950E